MFISSVLPRDTAPATRSRRGRQMAVTEQHAVSVPTLTAHVQAYEPDIERILISSDEIQAKLREMGEAITADYEGRELLLIGVLKGAFVVMAGLARHSRLPLEFDFMAVSSYGAAPKTSGVVRVLKGLAHDLQGPDRG